MLLTCCFVRVFELFGSPEQRQRSEAILHFDYLAIAIA